MCLSPLLISINTRSFRRLVNIIFSPIILLENNMFGRTRGIRIKNRVVNLTGSTRIGGTRDDRLPQLFLKKC